MVFSLLCLRICVCMSSQLSGGNEQVCEKNLNKCYVDLLQVISSFEKGSTAELSGRLRNVESGLQDLRESVKQIPDIGAEENAQREKIKDLYRIPFQKIEAQPTAEVRKNERVLQCLHCPSVVLLGNTATWVEQSHELPLARQTKGQVETEKETVTGFWMVPDMFDFENIGFTHAVDGVKYLTCADCEFGPVGIVDNVSKHNLVTPDRLKYKD